MVENPIEQLATLKRKKIAAVQNNKHEFYVPTGVGEKVIEHIGTAGELIFMLSAANGIGKTELGVNIVAELCWPSENGWFGFPLFDDWPYPKRIRIVSDPATVIGTIVPKMKEWFPAGRYTTDKKGKHHEYWWETDTGWIIEVMSFEQDPKEFESATLGFAWLDEPPPQSIYKATIARMRKGGKVLVTQTPITATAAYLYDQIIANVDNEKEGRAWVEADVETACKQHGVRGFLEHEVIVTQGAQYSEEEKHARLHGKFAHLTGLIFKMWSRNVHVIKPFAINMRDYCVYEALDPHPRNPDAVSWIAVDKDGTKFIIDELWVKPDKVDELAQRIKNKREGLRIVHKQCDPSAFIPDQHTGKSLAMRLSALGLTYTEATKHRSQADRRIVDALAYQERAGQMVLTPEIYVFDTCQRHIFEFEHYRWDEWKGATADNRDPRAKPVDKDDHMIENVGRILMQEPSWTPMISPLEQHAGQMESGKIGDPYA